MPRTPTAALGVAQPVIDAPAALRAVEAAVRHATALGVRVNVAVVDAAGVPAAFVRMAGAPLHSVEIANDKAYTAASFGLPTGAWHAALASHSEAVRQGLVLRPRFVAFGGGLPIGAYAGRADLMNLVAPAGPVYQAGTFCGHPVVMAAG
ncbi:MAG: hypothetical protein F9K35_17220, partial [Burkholderiaceae bacterium]